jgi:arylsulfatase A
LCATIDLLPTCVKLAGGCVPTDRIIDGKDIWPLLTKPETKSPHDVYYYYWDNGLDAIRSGEWKLHFPHAYRSLQGPPGKDGMPNGYVQAKTGLELYNLKADPAEKTDVAAANPDVIARLQKLAEAARDDLGDSLTKREGKNRRAADKLKD